MKKQIRLLALFTIGGLIMAQLVGCDEAANSAKNASDKAENAADKVAGEAGDAAKKMGDAAKSAAANTGESLSKLGEKAMGFLDPIKSEFGKLEGLVSEPMKLKEKAGDLVKKLDTDMSGVKLPQAVTDALSAAKEKLIDLRDYITDEADPAELKKRVEGVLESVKSTLGMG